MIFLYSGTPGSGKSIHMAKCIYWAVRMGRPVIANFEINTDKFEDASSFYYCPDEQLSPEKLIEFSKFWFSQPGNEFREGAIKLYWDEAQIRLNTRAWRENSEWIKFFTQHRKFGYDIILVAQYHEMLDKQVRTIIEYEVNHRKVNNVGWFGKIVGLFSFGHPVIVCVTRWYGQKMRLGSEWLLGLKKDYELYDSYKIFSQ